MAGVALTVFLFVATAQAPPQERLPEIRDRARSAAFAYESMLRRRAPETWGGSGGECDERVGRFCFQFGSGDEPDPPPAPEHPDVTAARARAIAAHRQWLAADPGSHAAAAPLVRYLVESGRPAEAVTAGRTHGAAAGWRSAAFLLLGLALHEDGRFVEAETAFDRGRALLPLAERKRLDDLRPLLSSTDRRLYSSLSTADRAAFHQRFWRLADPSLIDPGNERRSAHYARHAWARILSDAPRAQGMISWGDDHEEILIRYGRPTSRERVRKRLMSLDDRLSVVESFDPHAVALAPEALLSVGLPPAPPPGVRHEIERDSSRSAYAPVIRHRLRAMDVQAARFPLPGPGGSSYLQLVGALDPDTTAPRVPLDPHAVLVVLDTLGAEITRSTASTALLPDSSVLVSAGAALPPGAFVYSLELVDSDSTDLAGLTRYPVKIQPPAADGRLRLSDLVVAAPPTTGGLPRSHRDPRLRPLPDLVLPPGAKVLLFAEATGLETAQGRSRYEVEWWIEQAEPPSLLGRAARWAGRRLGLWRPEPPSRVSWEGSKEGDSADIGFVVTLDHVEHGLQRLHLRVRDRVSGLVREATRVVRVDPRATPAVPASDS